MIVGPQETPERRQVELAFGDAAAELVKVLADQPGGDLFQLDPLTSVMMIVLKTLQDGSAK